MPLYVCAVCNMYGKLPSDNHFRTNYQTEYMLGTYTHTKKLLFTSHNNIQAFCWWEVLMTRPAHDLFWMSHLSHRDQAVGNKKWHWHVSFFLLCCFTVVIHVGLSLSLTDACHPGNADRWGCPPVHLSDSSSPRTGPRCPCEVQRCCDSTVPLWSPVAYAHEQRWPAGCTAGLCLW